MSDVAETGGTVADVMLRKPKRLAADVTVAEAREAFENARTHVLLIADGERFVGAVSRIPDNAEPDDLAVEYADAALPTVTGDVGVSDALELLDSRPNGRIVVVDENARLLGLVCLARDG